MQNFALLSSILRGHWYMESSAYEAFLHSIRTLWEKDAAALAAAMEERPIAKEKQPFAATLTGSLTAGYQMGRYGSYDEAPAGSVAIITMRGVMMKNDSWYSIGTSTIRSWVMQAHAHPNISAIVVIGDTPGGQVTGTFELSDSLVGGKPVVYFAEGLTASGGYGVACQALEIIASHKTAMIGSIGTMITLQDWTEFDKRIGVREITVVATDSKDKNKVYADALAGKTGPLVEEILDPINQVFLATVRAGRKGKLNEAEGKKGAAGEPLTGKMYSAQAALDLGLIDAIGPLEYAIERALALAQANSSISYQTLAQEGQADPGLQPVVRKEAVTPQISNKPMKIKFLAVAHAALLAFFGKTVAAGQESTEVELSQEDLTKLNTRLAELEQANAASAQQVTDLQGQLATANQATTAAQTSANEWKTKAETYGSQPGATGTQPIKTEGDKVTTTASLSIHPAHARQTQVNNNY